MRLVKTNGAVRSLLLVAIIATLLSVVLVPAVGAPVTREQLYTRKVALRQIDGVVFIAPDYDRGVLIVGVAVGRETEDLVRRIRSAVDVPVEFLGEVTNRQQCTSRTIYCRPVKGGIQIDTVAKLTTLGFAATRSGVIGYVISGHALPYGSSGQTVYQPLAFEGNEVGTMMVNPACNRNSDIAWVQYSNVSPKVFTDPADRFVEGWGVSVPNLQVTMSGKESGDRTGSVVYVDVDINVPAQNCWFFDQVVANYSGVEGDSGAPVWNPGTGDKIVIRGVHAGATSACFNCSYYSPVKGMVADIPGLQVMTG